MTSTSANINKMDKTKMDAFDQTLEEGLEAGFTLEGVDQWQDIIQPGIADKGEIFGSVESISVHGDKTRESSTGRLL